MKITSSFKNHFPKWKKDPNILQGKWEIDFSKCFSCFIDLQMLYFNEWINKWIIDIQPRWTLPMHSSSAHQYCGFEIEISLQKKQAFLNWYFCFEVLKNDSNIYLGAENGWGFLINNKTKHYNQYPGIYKVAVVVLSACCTISFF